MKVILYKEKHVETGECFWYILNQNPFDPRLQVKCKTIRQTYNYCHENKLDIAKVIVDDSCIN